jgi:hypothetical protein
MHNVLLGITIFLSSFMLWFFSMMKSDLPTSFVAVLGMFASLLIINCDD